MEEDEKIKKKLKIGKIVIFTVKILFLLWIISARYGHHGRVCSGDFEGYQDLQSTSNYSSKRSYTFDRFSGFLLKLYVWIFLFKIFMTASIALWLGTDLDAEDVDDYNDDNYNRYSPSKFNDNETGTSLRSPSSPSPMPVQFPMTTPSPVRQTPSENYG